MPYGGLVTVETLLARIDTYRQRYGDKFRYRESGLELTLKRRTIALGEARRQMAEAAARVVALEAELARVEAAFRLEVEDAVYRTQLEMSEMWTPQPVIGYRMWGIGPFGLQGAKTVWTGPTLDAVCQTAFRTERVEVPHTDGRCGRLGCGIYAVRDLAALLDSELAQGVPDNLVVGEVALTGKVVEHEYGYRAAVATVTAAVVFHQGGAQFVDDPADLAQLFAAPLDFAQRKCRPFTGNRQDLAVTIFQERIPWTSELKNG